MVFEVLSIAIVLVVLFYIFFVRPARAEQSRRRRDLNALSIGDRVLTSGGLIATVTDVEAQPDGPMILHLELAEGVVVKAHPDAIAKRLPPPRSPLPSSTGTDASDAGPEDVAGGEGDRERDANGDARMGGVGSDTGDSGADEESPARRR